MLRGDLPAFEKGSFEKVLAAAETTHDAALEKARTAKPLLDLLQSQPCVQYIATICTRLHVGCAKLRCDAR